MEKEIKLPVSGKEVKGRTPKVKDVKNVSDISNDVEREMRLVGNLCEMTPDEIEDLEYKDYQELQKELLS